jgi:para-nitrobenzyl esterase
MFNRAGSSIASALIAVAMATIGGCAVPESHGQQSADDTAAAPPPRVRVESGEIIGVAANGVASFKGIPYAAPPVGNFRWRAPQPPRAWSAATSAADYGYSCAQPSPPARVVASSRAAIISEDCLTLNVWAPVHHARRLLPVMVWIHGGGNDGGTSAQTYYDGGSFARDGVVLVSLNYRLGVFGFFAHPALTAAAGSGARANFGLLDQLAALRWVGRNIRAFGGDPRNVTVFGESAGGADILLLMTARRASGAFQKAIVESAGWWRHASDLSQAQAAGATMATALGLPGAAATVAQLRSVPAESLTALPDFGELGPVVDHELLTEFPQAAFEHGHAVDVPLIIGTNGNEGSLLSADARATDMAPELSESDLQTVRSFYGSRASSEAAFVSLVFRDAQFSVPSRWVAARKATGAPTFLYRFDYVVSFLSGRRAGANHGSEIPFVFATWPDARLTAADRRVTEALHGGWVAFAKTGIPVCPQAPAWRPYSAESDTWMRFGLQAALEPVSDRAILDWLRDRSFARRE